MTERLLEKARAAKSAGELLALAREEGVDLTSRQAEELFAKVNTPPAGELSDDDLDDVSGGGCVGAWAQPSRFKVGDHVMETGASSCGTEHGDYRGAQYIRVTCHSPYWVVRRTGLTVAGTSRMCDVQCPMCGMSTTLSEGQLRSV